jgi:hypothetical protein
MYQKGFSHMSAPRIRFHRFQLLSLMLLCFALLALGLPGATITQAAGNGADYAADELGNPWDMDSTSDIAFEYTRDNDNLSSLIISGGELQATAKNGDPRITLLVPTNTAINPLPPEGGYRPVSTSKYRYLTVRMTAPNTTFAQVLWQASIGSTPSSSVFQQVSGGGYQTITIDLLANGNGRTGNAWNATSTIEGLYFDPGMLAGQYKIDYVRLSTSVPSAPDNLLPITRITSPSYISGPDYATNDLNDAWDMSESSDVAATHDLNPGSISFSGGIMNATNVQGSSNCGVVCGDAQVTLRTSGSINTGKYKYFTYRMQLDGAQDTVNGSVARLLWWSTKPEQASVTSPWIIAEGFQTVSFDLSKVKFEPGSFATWPNSAPIKFRFDPHEFAAPHTFHLDYVMLTGDSTANASFDIRYQASSAAATVQFFADTDTNPDNGAGAAISYAAAQTAAVGDSHVFLPLIMRFGATPPVVPDGSTCRWNTAGVAAGSYFIHSVTSDGVDTTNAYSQTPVIVSH